MIFDPRNRIPHNNTPLNIEFFLGLERFKVTAWARKFIPDVEYICDITDNNLLELKFPKDSYHTIFALTYGEHTFKEIE